MWSWSWHMRKFSNVFVVNGHRIALCHIAKNSNFWTVRNCSGNRLVERTALFCERTQFSRRTVLLHSHSVPVVCFSGVPVSIPVCVWHTRSRTSGRNWNFFFQPYPQRIRRRTALYNEQRQFERTQGSWPALSVCLCGRLCGYTPMSLSVFLPMSLSVFLAIEPFDESEFLPMSLECHTASRTADAQRSVSRREIRLFNEFVFVTYVCMRRPLRVQLEEASITNRIRWIWI